MAGLSHAQLVIYNGSTAAFRHIYSCKNKIYISNKLLELLSIDELTAVIGHEISHIKHSDGIRKILIFAALSGLITIGIDKYQSNTTLGNNNIAGCFVSAALITFSMVLTIPALMMFSRYQEYAADIKIVDYNIRPEHMISALEKIREASHHSRLSAFGRCMSTHPHINARTMLLKELTVNPRDASDVEDQLLDNAHFLSASNVGGKSSF